MWESKHLSRPALNDTAVSEKSNMEQVDVVFSDVLLKVKAVFRQRSGSSNKTSCFLTLPVTFVLIKGYYMGLSSDIP